MVKGTSKGDRTLALQQGDKQTSRWNMNLLLCSPPAGASRWAPPSAPKGQQERPGHQPIATASAKGVKGTGGCK